MKPQKLLSITKRCLFFPIIFHENIFCTHTKVANGNIFNIRNLILEFIFTLGLQPVSPR